jgi:LmbE family N-acetylglucosaminyl deacetylase
MKTGSHHSSFRRFLSPLLTLSVCGVVITLSHAQALAPAASLADSTSASSDRIALYQALLDLTNPWTVMCVAAHPDDEDGTTLTALRHKYGARTVSLFSTFGEGGQNAIGPELYEELGAIRAREVMAAAEIQGSEPYFLGLKDFGFSKSADEAFRVWGHDEALRRMILQIRKLRPDVIVTNHDTVSGHGHHQATGRLVLEAFDAAADPKRFPEQLKDGVTTWQVQRLFVRFGFGDTSGQRSSGEGVVSIDPNERDPIRNTTFAEQALQALQKHATQGPWPKTIADMARFRNSPDGKLPSISYRLVREAKSAAPLPSNSHYVLDGLRLPDSIAKQVEPPTIDGQPLVAFLEERQRVLNSLIALRKDHIPVSATQLSDGSRSQRMNQRLDGALATVTKISAAITARDEVVTPGVPTSFTVKISNEGTTQATVYSYTFFAGERNVKTLYTGSTPLLPQDSGSVMDDWTVPPDSTPSLPHPEHLYDGRLFGDEFKEVVTINLQGARFSVSSSVRVDVGSAVDIANVSPSPMMVTPTMLKRGSVTSAVNWCAFRDFQFDLRITNHQGSLFSGEVIAGAPRKPSPSRTITIPPRDSKTVTVPITGCSWIQAGKAVDRQRLGGVSFSVVGKGSAKPVATLDVPVVWADARVTPNLHLAYVRGLDYSLPNALAALGVESKELSVDDVRTADLKGYNTIIVDNRAYELVPGLISVNQRLLDFAKDGGTLIVFYHKSNEWNPNPRLNRPQLAPYPLTLGNERVTDEDAAVSFLVSDHPLLNAPNKIGPEDFKDWIQERGLYYPRDWDSHYTALFAMNDPGEGQLRGGLLAADYGRGHYIYTSMVWYRQLRAGVPGAYRMLANMISYGHGDK